ncbi:type II toxin-antitoxin system RelE/ParE family toxin [Achromobacter xylosoxidans]|uniref:type II toxin-antitoxin system RelE/ParE family toxin n=1 Tax=Alcaligenes xylosoxydans xylosoxydans TaxID=85698 RepID=UPI0006C1A19B|nr:type II toxin-antitoxin system RelE/ParE family toxin [Achromobacter xylosoxidans]CUI49281.1 putative addiction module killer protein [Achromobacter xylosoxidans]
MAVATIELRRYVTAQGISPFGVWLRELGDAKLRAWIEVRLKRIGAGLLGDWRAVGQGVIEFRLDIGPGYRVYAGRQGTRLIVLLAGGAKGTQRHDIELARRYWADWKQRQA